MNNIHFSVLIFIILALVIKYSEGFLSFRKNCKKQNNNSSEEETIKRETSLSYIKKIIFSKYNITHGYNEHDWDIHLPCGLNDIEYKIKAIHVSPMRKQVVYAINGCDKITRKENLWVLLKSYYSRQIAKTLMPESYLLDNQSDMKLFKQDFDPRLTYILKKNIQRKKGILLTNKLDDVIYANKDNKKIYYKVVQKFIENSHIIQNRVVNLRLYFLITTRNNNVSFYIHNQGKCLYSASNINQNKLDFNSRITNSYKTDLSIYKTCPLTLQELKDYLNRNSNNGTLLFKNIFNLFKKLSLAIKYSNLSNTIFNIQGADSNNNIIYNSSNLQDKLSLQLFGADVIFDNNMKPYLLELNKGPDMKPKDKKDYKIKYKVELDMLHKTGLIRVDDPTYVNEFKEIIV